MAKESTVPFKLNMPASLKDRLEQATHESGRSLTAEIVARLEKSFDADDEWSTALDNISYLLERVEDLESVVQSHAERISSDQRRWK